MSKYKAILTTAGAAKIAAASAGGKPLKIDRLAVGDGNGKLPTPNPAQTKLINERYRAALNSLTTDKALPDRLIAELIIPASVGGFWLREMGLYDADGVLIAVSNMAESYKPKLEEGSGRTQTLRMVLIVSHTEAITLIVNGDMVTATRDFVAAAIDDHAKSRNHPDGTTTAKGFVQLSSVTNSTSETLAATPKAVKAVNDAAVKLTQNLADLPDKAKARANLGLKSAALCETGEATGQVLTANRAFGLGLMQPERRHKLADLGGANAFTGFTWSAVSDPDTPPIAASAGIINHAWRPSATAAPYVLQLAWRQGRAAFRTKDSNMDFLGWSELLHTGNAYTAAQSDGKYALRSIKVNGKPLSADVNLLAGDVNAWNKTEADARYLKLSGGTVKSLTVKTDSTSTENTAMLITGVEHTPLILKRSSATANLSIGFQLGASTPLYRLGIDNKSNLCWGTEANQAVNSIIYHTNNKPSAADVNAWNKTEADGRYLMKTGGQLSGIVKTSSEFQSTNQNNYRIIGGNYGTFWRQDGNALYLLMTNPGDQLGSYSSHRPFAVSMTSGGVTLGTQMTLTDANFVNKMGFATYTDGAGKVHRQANGLRLRVAETQLAEFYYNETVGQSAEVSLHNKYGTTDSYFSLRNDGLLSISGVNPQINFSGGTVYANDGNVYGSVWGGYLSNYIANQVSTLNTNLQAWVYKHFAQAVRLSGRVVVRDTGGHISLPPGCVYTAMSGSNYDPNIWGAYSAVQVLINGQWATVETV
ncbi:MULTISPECIES: phage tail protein [unclassified Serratia (in: enterobacteria)]|uniref:phage tail protein n=1 Tax=unclassified Serratia (in: enterobacteria) TaxID=2647522 RepID=UPI00046B0642|nr:MULTISPECIES: phage tail protein [unclassified Serratia (in: enterobacteria)]